MRARYALLLLGVMPSFARGHAYLAVPRSRNAVHMTRPPIDYCPHCLNAGGPRAVGGGALWPQGHHGICGDPFTQPEPRDHEAGGTYASDGTVAGTYREGDVLNLTTAISTYHGGRVSFRVCRYAPGDAAAERAELTEGCLDQHKLVQANVPFAQAPGSEFYDLNYISPYDEGFSTPLLVSHAFQLPAGLTCDGAAAKCVLQWHYETGNSCNLPGTPERDVKANLPACGTPGSTYPEEFWNCADIRIQPAYSGASVSYIPRPKNRHVLADAQPSAFTASDDSCTDIAPSSDSTCAQQAGWGKCGEPWMNSFCLKSCGRCSAAVPGPVPSGDTTAYADVLGLSWLFYEAQRSGKLPASNRIPWRGDSHLGDLVPGGWHDAGDHLKLHLPMATSASFLAWGVLDFSDAYSKTDQTQYALDSLRTAASYLMACHTQQYEFVGQIGDPGPDHSYWGRPEDQTGPRPAFVYNYSTPATDLLGAASAALSSSSLVFQPTDPGFAAQLLDHAKQLYAWAAAVPGKYNAAYPGVTSVYPSSRFTDKLMYAAAWLCRATGDKSYLDSAHSHYQSMPDADRHDIFVGWDSMAAPAANLLLGLQRGASVPGADDYAAFLSGTYLPAWQTASNGVSKTPKGLYYPGWSQWGNLRHAANAGFMQLIYHKHTPCPACVQWAKSQADYMLGSTGRSFVVGYGTNPPVQPHHRAASCPDRPAPCDWNNFNYAGPSPQVLHGALVGGPTGQNGDAYTDVRSDFVGNEVAVDYNAGFTGLMAGLVQLL